MTDYYEFPETFPHWETEMDSIKLLALVREVLQEIDIEIQKPAHERFILGGLRKTLQLIASAENITL